MVVSQLLKRASNTLGFAAPLLSSIHTALCAIINSEHVYEKEKRGKAAAIAKQKAAKEAAKEEKAKKKEEKAKKKAREVAERQKRREERKKLTAEKNKRNEEERRQRELDHVAKATDTKKKKKKKTVTGSIAKAKKSSNSSEVEEGSGPQTQEEWSTKGGVQTFPVVNHTQHASYEGCNVFRQDRLDDNGSKLWKFIDYGYVK